MRSAYIMSAICVTDWEDTTAADTTEIFIVELPAIAHPDI